MPGQAPIVDLTARSFEALRERALNLLKRRVGDVAYNDFVGTGVVPAIIDVMAWFFEQAAFYHDRRHRSSYLFLADTREAMVVLCRGIGYRMRPTTSAAVSVQATPQPPQVAPITLRKGTRVTVGELIFEVAADSVIPANANIWPDGTTDDLILLVEGATSEDTFTSTGAIFQEFSLSQQGTIDGSVIVTILNEVWAEVENLTFVESDTRGRDTFHADGQDFFEVVLTLLNANIQIGDEDGLAVLVTPPGMTSADVQVWTQVPALTGAPREFTASQDIQGYTTIRFGEAVNDAAPAAGATIDVLYIVGGSQKRYQLTYDEFDRATIRFGDDTFGVIPPTGAQIRVQYRVGGGVRGNIPAGTMDQDVQGFLPTGARCAVHLRNAEPGRGGEPQETIEHARFFAPAFARSNRRAVTQDDWTALAATYRDDRFGAPSHASAYLKQRIPELNTVCVAVWGRDNVGRISTPGTALKVGIKKFLDARRTITTVAEMLDGVVVIIDLLIAVTLETGRDRETVFTAVSDAISRFFNSASVLPGLDLSISQLYDTIQDVDGVARATIEQVTGGISAFLTLGVGDGVTKTFSGNFPLRDGTSVVAGSVAVTDTVQQVVDNGTGSFVGDVDSGGTNVITYGDGNFTTTFAVAPEIGRVVTAEAHLGVFAPHTENLGNSNGTFQLLDGATDYYPIVKRAPRGGWAGDQSRIIDDYRVGGTNRFRGRLPRGIDPTSIVIGDNVPLAPVLVGGDNGAGVINGAGILTGSVDYDTGDIDFEFNAPPTLPVRIQWTTNRVDIFLPAEYLPLQPGRVWFWGGFRGPNATQPGGADLNVFDDGTGNMVGDALVSGQINYETGAVNFAWNAVPPPGIATATYYGRLAVTPDGTNRTFAYTVRTAPGGAGVAVNLLEGVGNGIGRTRFRLTDLSKPGVSFFDAWDNWQGLVDGESLDREGTNTLVYGPAAAGTLTFLTPPVAGTTRDFVITTTNVGTFMYSAWAFLVKTPGGPGLDKYLFSDNNGRLWGTVQFPFPFNRLDHLRGRYLATLSGAPVASGRSLQLTYDALIAVPPHLDIPIQGDQVATLGKITLEERAPEVPTLG